MSTAKGCRKSRQTVFFWLCEADHVLWEDLGHAADFGGDDVEAGTRGLEDGDAERLGEGGIEEDRAP